MNRTHDVATVSGTADVSQSGDAHAGSTLGAILRWRADHQPDRVSHIFAGQAGVDDQRVTYAELDRLARAIAVRLRQKHAAGDRALLMYPPGLEFVAALLGCMHAGIVAVPLQVPRQRGHLPRVRAILDDAAPSLALTTSKALAAIQAVLAEDPGFAALEWIDTDAVAAELADAWSDARITRDALALIQYTSGSTGAPKGVMVTHGNILYNSLYIQRSFTLSDRSVSVSWLPSFHDMGLIDGVIQPLYTGCQGVLISPLSFIQRPLRWLATVSRFGGTHTGAPNFAYDLCVDRIAPAATAGLDLSSLESLYNGAEPVRRATLERFVDRFTPCGLRSTAFYACYGLAEATLMVSGGDVTSEPVTMAVDKSALEQGRVLEVHHEPDRSLDLVGCGRAWLDTDVRIVDPASCRALPPLEIGEVWVSGPTVCAGYWRKPEASREVFDGRLADSDGGPYLRTGDLGFLRGDELFIVGRIKDLVIIHGRNHYPQDIEWTVAHAHGSLRHDGSAAFSVDADGAERLVVVQELERVAQNKPDVDGISREVNRALAEEHEVELHTLVLVKSGTVPKTSSGKVQRRVCREQFLNSGLTVVARWSREGRPSTAAERNV